jgi:tetratricopeptide (TPR) repeat protein
MLNPGPRAVECRKNAIDSLKRYSDIRQDAAGSIEYRYTQVAASIVQGRFVEADRASDRLLAEVQTDERVWLLKAVSQIARMNFAGAAATLTKLIEDVAPQLWRPYFFRGWIRLVAKDWDRAVEDCSRAIELDPRQARVYAVRAAAHIGRNDFTAARADYDLAIQYLPRWEFVWTARAGVRLRLGDARGAVEDATQGMELGPSEPSAAFVRSQARWALGDAAGAVEDASQVIKLHPKDVDAYIWRSHLRFTSGDRAGGVKDATRLTELEPKEGGHWYRLGKLWLAQEEFRKALENFLKAVACSPGLASELDPLIAQCRAKLGE